MCVAEAVPTDGGRSVAARTVRARASAHSNNRRAGTATVHGLVEMMTDPARSRGSDRIDVIWASHENALINAELYYALILWGDVEELLSDGARATDIASAR